MSVISRRSFIALGAGTAAAAALAGCASRTPGSGTTTAASRSAYMVPPKTGPLLIGFSATSSTDAFGRQQLLELQDEAKRLSADVRQVLDADAAGSADKQVADIESLVGRGVDVLLIDAASDTALDATLEQAQAKGVLLVSFRNTVSSPRALAIGYDQERFGEVGGAWLAGRLARGDRVVTIDGPAGSADARARLTGATQALEKAGIVIAAGAATDWDQAEAHAATEQLLAEHPDAKGVYSSNGVATLGALEAMSQPGMKLLPVPGDGLNGFLRQWKQLRGSVGFESIAPSAPPSLAAAALRIAVRTARGEDPGRTPTVDLPVITSDTLDAHVRADVPATFYLPTGLSAETIQRNYLPR